MRTVPGQEQRRDSILEATAFAAQRFLLSPDWREIADEVLERLGRSAGVSRTWLFENHSDDLGRLCSSQRVEWTAPGFEPQISNPQLQDSPWTDSGFARWEELLGRGEVVHGLVADLPESERPELEPQGILSVLAIPVFVGAEWWGTMGFDDCERERVWDLAEIEALRAAAGTLGAAIHRERSEEQLREAETRYRTIVERTPAVTYQELAEEQTQPSTSIAYVSPQIERILGYPASSFSTIPGFWTQILHPDDRDRVIAESERTGRTGEPYSQEYRMIATDGRVVWFHDESVLARDEAGRPKVWQGVMMDITARRETEARLSEAELRYRTLVEYLPIVTYRDEVTEEDPTDATPTYISPQIQGLLGVSPDQWVADPDSWGDSVHPEDRERVESEGDHARMTGAPFRAEYRMVAADGRIVWVREEAVLVRDDYGRPRYWQGVYVDITERRQADEALRDAEQRYRSLVERLPAVVYIQAIPANPGSGSLYISPRVLDVLGYTPDEWRWTKGFWVERIHPEERERIRAVDERVNSTFEPFAEEYRLRTKDGQYLWIYDEAFVVRDDQGNPRYWQGFLLDITERKAAELQLRDAEERFRTLVEQNPAVIYTQVIDSDDPSASSTVYISPVTESLVGYTVEETVSNPHLWREIIHPDDRETVWAADAASNATGDPFDMEYRMIRKDGRVVWIHDRATLVRDERGNPKHWQGFQLDITERREAEERLARALEVEREATSQLRALDEMKNTFLQAVSHDLRTPLAAILGLAVTLERGDINLPREDVHDLAARIAGNARKLDRLVTDLLDLDRLSRGIIEPKLHPTDLGALARRVASDSDLADDGRVEVEADEIVVEVDAPKVERIIENLLANTSRHTPPGTHVWVRVSARDEGALLSVEDDGPGIPKEHREAIFEPFRQGPGAPSHSPGVGVGLALVARFAELHGGRAWVEERDGGGAAFRVFLPRRMPGT